MHERNDQRLRAAGQVNAKPTPQWVSRPLIHLFASIHIHPHPSASIRVHTAANHGVMLAVDADADSGSESEASQHCAYAVQEQILESDDLCFYVQY